MLLSWQESVASYDYLTLHLVPGPRSLVYFLPFTATPAVLAITASRLSTSTIRYAILPVLIAVQVFGWWKYQDFDVISMNHVLMMFELLGYYDVRKDFKHVVRISKEDYELQPYPEELFPRLQWIGTLLISLRLTDWHIGLPSHDKQQPSSIHPFKSFYLNTLAHAIFSYVLLSYAKQDAVCTNPSGLLFLARIYAVLALGNSLLPVLIALSIVVPLGLKHNALVSPLTWPSHFGDISSIVTGETSFGLRAFWGQFWHQNMRYLTSTPGLALANYFGLVSGTFRYMIIVCVSFFFSGVVHMGVIPTEPLHGSALELRLRLASFFWVQPIGMAVEILLSSMFGHKTNRRTNSKQYPPTYGRAMLWRVVILCWTIGFLAWTANYTIRPVGCTMGWWNLPFL